MKQVYSVDVLRAPYLPSPMTRRWWSATSSAPPMHSSAHTTTLACVSKLLSCISSYNNKHRCATIEAAFKAHRHATLVKHSKKRRRHEQAAATAATADTAQHTLAMERMQHDLDLCRQQLRRAQVDREQLQAQLDEWRETAMDAEQQRDALQQQLIDVCGALPIHSHPPQRDRAAQPLTAFYSSSKRHRVRSRTAQPA